VDERGIESFGTFKKILQRRSRIFHEMNSRYGAGASLYFMQSITYSLALLVQMYMRVQLLGYGILSSVYQWNYGGVLLQEACVIILICILSGTLVLILFMFNKWILDLPKKTMIESAMLPAVDRLFRNEKRTLRLVGLTVDASFTLNMYKWNILLCLCFLVPGWFAWVNRWV
jgi:hypothetical protein